MLASFLFAFLSAFLLFSVTVQSLSNSHSERLQLMKHGGLKDAYVGGERIQPGLKAICPHVVEEGCVRYFQGFDITGVTTEVDLTIQNGIFSPCDCLAACKLRNTTCDNWVWKFTDPSGHRTCTLYSSFNLPSGVTIQYNAQSSTNILNLQPGNNPQAGSTIPQCTLDGTNGVDPDCISGPLFVTSTNRLRC